MRRIVCSDVGGTHARFALATIAAGKVVALDRQLTLRTAEHAGFEAAWEKFGEHAGERLPRELAIAFAGPVGGELLRLTNSAWVIRPGRLAAGLGVERHVIVNDFGAVAHAVTGLDDAAFTHLCGDERPLPEDGVVTVIGPGTGLGVASLVRRPDHYHVIETEGGHVDYAPLDAIEDRILARLRDSFGRVSVERLVSGHGLVNIYDALCGGEPHASHAGDAKALWATALAGTEPSAAAALERLCRIFGAVAGDIALAQGADAVVIAGGLGLRLKDYLPRSGFAARFVAKGRFERRMAALPVKLVTYQEPGLFGAATAFARAYP